MPGNEYDSLEHLARRWLVERAPSSRVVERLREEVTILEPGHQHPPCRLSWIVTARGDEKALRFGRAVGLKRV